MTYIPILHISYQLFPKQDVCTSENLQVTQKVPRWSETEAPSDGFIVINVNAVLCWYLGENTHLVDPLSCDHQNSGFVDANKGCGWDLNPTSGLQLGQEV